MGEGMATEQYKRRLVHEKRGRKNFTAFPITYIRYADPSFVCPVEKEAVSCDTKMTTDVAYEYRQWLTL